MPKISIIGFRGVGLRVAEFKQTHPLICTGHVGIAFEGHKYLIYGFHPTSEAVQQAGGIEALFELLKEHIIVDGALENDYDDFVLAFELSQQNVIGGVWQVVYEYSQEEFDDIYNKIVSWYSNQTTFPYAFPPRNGEVSTQCDNCATFPRHLNIPLPEPTGQLTRYILKLQDHNQPWKPD